MRNTHPLITAWAVRASTGAISLFSDRARADAHACQYHGTVHQLVEVLQPPPAPVDLQTFAQPARPEPRMPQGEITEGGVMRL